MIFSKIIVPVGHFDAYLAHVAPEKTMGVQTTPSPPKINAVMLKLPKLLGDRGLFVLLFFSRLHPAERSLAYNRQPTANAHICEQPGKVVVREYQNTKQNIGLFAGTEHRSYRLGSNEQLSFVMKRTTALNHLFEVSLRHETLDFANAPGWRLRTGVLRVIVLMLVLVVARP